MSGWLVTAASPITETAAVGEAQNQLITACHATSQRFGIEEVQAVVGYHEITTLNHHKTLI